MMNRYKTIAVVHGHIESAYHSDALCGIITQAKKLGYNVAIFSVFELNDELTATQIGEENIYNLINFDEIVGILYYDSAIWAKEMKLRIVDLFNRKAGGKVVCVNSNDSFGFDNVLMSEDISFAQIVDHMIDVHGLKKIYCLTGPECDRISQIRLQGYLNSMEKHGLEVKDSYIFYGDFWENAAKQLANDIVDGKYEKPDAVVCANDFMALNLCNTLIDRGLKVPDDIAIAGYDSIYDSYENIPSITTYSKSLTNVGAKAVCKLHEKVTGEIVEPYVGETGEVITGESCGCGKNIEYVKKYGRRIREIKRLETQFYESSMLENITVAKNFEKCLCSIIENFYLLTGVYQFALCLNENWDNFSEGDSEYIRTGYAENSVVKFYKNGENCYVSEIKFKTEDMFPPVLLEDGPISCYFTPLHFADRCFGFSVVKYESDDIACDKIYRLWMKNVITALEYVRVKQRLSIINDRIYISSLRDALTGIYNRCGYEKYSEEIFEQARKEKKKLLIIVSDLDRLKYINDSFGHAEGDNALTVIAQALQSCSGNSEKCARIGGDEFAIIGCYDYNDVTTEYYKKRIYGYLTRYNEMSHKDYEIGASIGCFCDFVDEYENVDQCFSIADKLMYEDKIERRKNRME